MMRCRADRSNRSEMPSRPGEPRSDARIVGAFARRCSLILALILAPAAVGADPVLYRAGAERFVRDMADRHGIDPAELQSLLGHGGYRRAILDAMDRPYEAKPWHDYRALFLTPDRIARGIVLLREQAAVLARAEQTYGVDPAVITAILGVETNYGSNLGRHAVLDALTTLAFVHPRRADFFRGELEAFVLLSREEGLDAATAMGSYAGAMGQPQFIPSSYRNYAVDFDGDGRRDLWASREDAIGSVANYFKAHGWRRAEPVAAPARLTGALPIDLPIAEKAPVAPSTTAGALRAAGVQWDEPVPPETAATLIRLEGPDDEYWVGFDNLHVITRYNRSNLYALAVHLLSQAIRSGVELAAVESP